MGVNEKNWPKGQFTLEQVDFLNRNAHYPEWREAVSAVFARARSTAGCRGRPQWSPAPGCGLLAPPIFRPIRTACGFVFAKGKAHGDGAPGRPEGLSSVVADRASARPATLRRWARNMRCKGEAPATSRGWWRRVATGGAARRASVQLQLRKLEAVSQAPDDRGQPACRLRARSTDRENSAPS